MNDIFSFVTDSSLYNYADDNTLSYVSEDVKNLVNVLEKDSKSLIEWFNLNKMQANPDNFRQWSLERRPSVRTLVLTLTVLLLNQTRRSNF